MISFILVLFPFRRPHSRLIAVLIMSFGVFTIFPVFQAVNRGMSFETDIEIPKASEYMLYGDFDGFQTTMNVVIHTEQNGHTMGHQMLSAALFFVPRSFWKGKGEATAEMVSADLGWHFTNLSTPIVGELYIDWGFIGVVIGGFLIGHLFRRLDLMYTAAVDYGGGNAPAHRHRRVELDHHHPVPRVAARRHRVLPRADRRRLSGPHLALSPAFHRDPQSQAKGRDGRRIGRRVTRIRHAAAASGASTRRSLF